MKSSNGQHLIVLQIYWTSLKKAYIIGNLNFDHGSFHGDYGTVFCILYSVVSRAGYNHIRYN